MCLPNFIRLVEVPEQSPMIGYRNWRLPISKDNQGLLLRSECIDYTWNKVVDGPHIILTENSGIYAYNYYNNYYNYYYYYNNNYYYYNNNYYNYYISGVIHQWGTVAIHEDGQRSEYAKIVTLFTIRPDDAKGPEEFLQWIKVLNSLIERLATFYECKTQHYQDFIKSNK